MEACRSYFSKNPYDQWFKRVESVISGTKASYYDSSRSACHLDLVPFATVHKWSKLSGSEQERLLEITEDTLGLILRNSSVRVLVLNGRSVVDRFQTLLSGSRLKEKVKPDWSRSVRGRPSPGIAYKGKVNALTGFDLQREVLVLGFNHNFPGTPVSGEVRRAIKAWVARSAERFSSKLRRLS